MKQQSDNFDICCPNGCTVNGLEVVGYHPIRGKICLRCGRRVIIDGW